MDGKPMWKWTLPIQPNSLVAVFSTIAKSALLYPLAECLGQLKWVYFKKPRVLSQMQTFNAACRGPWGATVFLWKTKGTVMLASMGALITIFMLGFEPFAQQVIQFSSQLTPLPNLNRSVTVTTA